MTASDSQADRRVPPFPPETPDPARRSAEKPGVAVTGPDGEDRGARDVRCRGVVRRARGWVQCPNMVSADAKSRKCARCRSTVIDRTVDDVEVIDRAE